VSTRALSPAEKLQVALDLFDTGVELKRQNLRRQYPEETADQIEARILVWLRTRPGAEHGDGVGRPRPFVGPA
jgi:hypothetical protein